MMLLILIPLHSGGILSLSLNDDNFIVPQGSPLGVPRTGSRCRQDSRRSKKISAAKLVQTGPQILLAR